MEAQRNINADTYPTRRSLREAEQRARKAQGSGHQGAVEADATPVKVPTPRTAVPSLPKIPATAGLMSRALKSVKVRILPRVAILASLAAATTLVPLNGIPASMASDQEAVALSASDVLDVLMDDEGEVLDGVDTEALAADPLVGVRAAVSASRSSEGRSMTTCSDQAGAANGAAAAEVAAVQAPDLIMPLAEGSYRLTSHYGYRSLWGRHSMHTGLDMAATAGTPIHSIADGVVEYTGPGKDGRSSMLIIIRHDLDGQVVRSWYVHMYSNGVYTTPGQQVKVGQVIGAVGSNGNSTGPHLHLEIHLDDNLTTTDPGVWLAANGAAPLDADLRDCLEQ